jgi:hypothetical protein
MTYGDKFSYRRFLGGRWAAAAPPRPQEGGAEGAACRRGIRSGGRGRREAAEVARGVRRRWEVDKGPTSRALRLMRDRSSVVLIH